MTSDKSWHLKKIAVFLLTFSLNSGSKYIFFPAGCWPRGRGLRVHAHVTHGNEGIYSIFFSFVDSHKQRIISVYGDTNIQKVKQSVACKVFQRLALLIKMEHALSTQPSRDVRDVTWHHHGIQLPYQRNVNIMFYSSMNTLTLCLFLYNFDNIRFTNHVNGYSHPYKMYSFFTHIKWPCMCEPKGINPFSLRQNLRLLLTLFESKPHIIIIFHLKTKRQKLEKHHVNGSQTRICSEIQENCPIFLTKSIKIWNVKSTPGLYKIFFYECAHDMPAYHDTCKP